MGIDENGPRCQARSTKKCHEFVFIGHMLFDSESDFPCCYQSEHYSPSHPPKMKIWALSLLVTGQKGQAGQDGAEFNGAQLPLFDKYGTTVILQQWT